MSLPYEPGRKWSGKYFYLAGLDDPIDTKGRSEVTTKNLLSIQANADVVSASIGRRQRINGIKS